MSVKRKVTVPRGSSPTPRVYDAAIAPDMFAGNRLVAPVLGGPVRELAERDHADEDTAGREHHEDDLAPLLGSRLDGQERVEERGEHGPEPTSLGRDVRREGRRSSRNSS